LTKYFVDVESTGTNLEKDRVIQLAVLIEDEKGLRYFNDLCYSDREISYSAMGVHHITPDMLEDKFWADETDSFLALQEGNSKSNYFISHSNELDLAMLKNEGFECEMKIIDTQRCALHLLKDAEDYKLQTLRYQYGLYKKEQKILDRLSLDSIKPHDALSDAILHYLLFEFLLERVESIDKLVELTTEPILLDMVNFGKYKDKMSFQELFETNPNYLVWVYANMNMWEDLEYTVEFWLKKDSRLWKKAQGKRKRKSLF
jgi:DNA polymerase III epsilon subunit-like protein